jgi:hypothetical protein
LSIRSCTVVAILTVFFRSGPSTSESSLNTIAVYTKTSAESLNKYQQRFYY